MLLHWSCGQHSSIWNRGLLSLESRVSIAYVAGDLSGQKGGGWCSGEKGRTAVQQAVQVKQQGQGSKGGQAKDGVAE